MRGGDSPAIGGGGGASSAAGSPPDGCSAGPAAVRTAPSVLPVVTTRLARAAAVLGVLAVPAVLTDLAHGASHGGGYDYSAAWDSLFDDSNAGRLSGPEVTLPLVAAVPAAPLAAPLVRTGAVGRGWPRACGVPSSYGVAWKT